MTSPMPIKELIDPIINLSGKVDNLPDGPRARFIGCVLNAATLSIRLDKPLYDVPGLLRTNLDMARRRLDEWTE